MIRTRKERRDTIKDIAKQIKESDIAEINNMNMQYCDDMTANFKANFDLSDASLLLGISIDAIRHILLNELPDNSSRRKTLIWNMQNEDLDIRVIYPGGYTAFIEDVNNGYYGTVKNLAPIYFAAEMEG